MKKQMLLLVLLATLKTGHAQNRTKEDYLHKSANQKKVAWLLSGTGATLVLVSLITYPSGYTFLGFNSADEQRQANTSIVLFIAGGTSMLASIPFFILSGSNKRKASTVSFRIDRIQAPGAGSGAGWSVYSPGLALRIGL
ncbi:MAG: hypothetical protein IPG86_07385 [Chitinophagaceae bacterium]|nr:hypothetical protein [Chitinophagaceae bacterium]